MSVHQQIEAFKPTAMPSWPRLLSADLAGAYLGIGKTFFLDCVAKHELPAGVRLGRRVLWDRAALDSFVDVLFGNDEPQKERNDFEV